MGFGTELLFVVALGLVVLETLRRSLGHTKMSATLEIYPPPVAQAHVRLLSPEPWLASATKVYSGVGADMESLHSLSGRERKRLIYKGECQEKYFSLDRKWRRIA